MTYFANYQLSYYGWFGQRFARKAAAIKWLKARVAEHRIADDRGVGKCTAYYVRRDPDETLIPLSF